MIVVSLLGRKYLVDKDKKFIIREIPRHMKEGDVLTIKGYEIVDNSIQERIVDLQVKKTLKNKITILKKKRRKRYKLKMGYKQMIGYFQIINIKNNI